MALDCTTESLDYDPPTLHVGLLCEGVEHTLHVSTQYRPRLPLGSEVRVDAHFTATTHSTESLIRMTTLAGDLLLAAAHSPVVPGEGRVPADFFAPPRCRRPRRCMRDRAWRGGGPCYDVQREMIRFSLDGDRVYVLDRNTQWLAGLYRAAVAVAELRHDNTCDNSDRWYQWVVYEPLSD